MTSNVDFGILLSLVSLQPPYIAGRNCIVSLKKIHLEHIGVRSGSKHSKIDSPHCGYIFHKLWTFFPPLCSTSAHFVNSLRSVSARNYERPGQRRMGASSASEACHFSGRRRRLLAIKMGAARSRWPAVSHPAACHSRKCRR